MTYADRDRTLADLRVAESAGRAAEQRYRNLVELSPDAIFVHREGRIAFANPACAALFGASSVDDLVGRSPFDLVHPRDRAAIVERARRLLAREAGTNPTAELRILRLDGTERTVEANSSTFEDAEGRAIEVVLRDVTERRLADERLRAGEERLRAHIDNSPLAVIEFDPQFTVRSWSQGAERMFGWSADEIIGRRIAEVRWVHEDDVECVKQESRRLLSGGCTRTLNANRNYRKDGSVIHCEWYSSALHDAEGRLISILSQVLDVTARKRAEEGLQSADRRKTEFLAVLSHELRNYLAPMRNGMRVLERTPAGSPPSRRATAIIGRQVEHLTRLVNDLVDISRINVGEIALERTRLDAREVVARACEDLRPAFEERGLVLRLDVAATPLWIDADQDRLTQVAGNLLGNALKFSSPPASVHVSVLEEAGLVALRVRDEGAGIDPEFLPGIFEQYAQAERQGTTRGGMGIGLALVKTLAALHGGAVRALSEGSGKGAEFVVSLPLAAGPPPQVQEPLAPRARSLDILIVEDNRDAAETLEQVLRLEGHRTRVVCDGRSATAAFRERRPDAVISDVGLPDVSGYELIRGLRQLDGGARPVFAVALTGYAQADDVQRAKDAGFDAHLSKPASLERLEELLAAASARAEEATAPGP